MNAKLAFRLRGVCGWDIDPELARIILHGYCTGNVMSFVCTGDFKRAHLKQDWRAVQTQQGRRTGESTHWEMHIKPDNAHKHCICSFASDAAAAGSGIRLDFFMLPRSHTRREIKFRSFEYLNTSICWFWAVCATWQEITMKINTGIAQWR